jgi:spoIIIJ-associated protein
VAGRESGRTSRRRVAKASGRTVEIALSRALAELDFAPGELSDDQYRVTILTQPEDGFLGVGGIDAVLEVELLPDDGSDDDAFDEFELGPLREDVPEELEEDDYDEDEDEDSQPEAGSARLREFLTVVVNALHLDAKIRIVEQIDSVSAEVTGEDLGVFIGKRGQTIDAIEYLASIVLYPRPERRKRVEIDAEGYKERRRITIERVAMGKAQEATRRGKPVELEPMTSAERKIVHVSLRDRRDVITESKGREPNRSVVITPTRSGQGR